ncbi:MAG TPA: alpha/beta hydrolase [Candidatus Eisenbacteria bacterium]|nr:alpha/beta hydrolase [Candidatus Eisenbacteria bacterium]
MLPDPQGPIVRNARPALRGLLWVQTCVSGDYMDAAILAGTATPALAAAIADKLGIGLSPCRAERFPDGDVGDRIEAKAPRIKAPVLVVRGEHDPIANHRWCEDIARLRPHGRLEIILGVAHTLCYTAPVQLAALTRSFVHEARESS